MAKLLETRLPLASGLVSPETYNRMVRILEINLNRFDPTATPEYTETVKGQNQFNAGDIIWNTTRGTLQVYTGALWKDVSTRTSEVGLEGTGSVGTLTVATNGSTSILLA